MSVRDELLAAVNERLSLIAEPDDFSMLLDPNAVLEAVRLREVANAGSHFQADLALGWFYWYQQAALRDSPDERETAMDSAWTAFHLVYMIDAQAVPAAMRSVFDEVITLPEVSGERPGTGHPDRHVGRGNVRNLE